MSCCGKAKNIIQGFTRLATDKIGITERSPDTDARTRICQKCEKNYWLGRRLFCSICKCFIPAKARVKDEKCPIGLWN